MSTLIIEETLRKLAGFRSGAESIQSLAWAVDTFRTHSDAGAYASTVDDVYFLIEEINADCAAKARSLTSEERATITDRIGDLEKVIATLGAADSDQ